MDKIIKIFCVVYFLLGVSINLESFLYLKNKIIEDDDRVSTAVTLLGVCLFCVDMLMLMFYYFTIIIIVRYYTKDHKVNTCRVWLAVHLVALTYTVEMVWSDLFMFGSYFNNDDVYFKHKADHQVNYYIFNICTFNSIFCTWVQGLLMLAVFSHFGKLKFDSKRRSLNAHKINVKKSSNASKTSSQKLNDPTNPSSLLSLLTDPSIKREKTKSLYQETI